MLEITTTQEEILKAGELAATSMVSRPRVYSMVDLFAGCGGLSLGFENAAFTPVFVNELHDDALKTYLLNRHHELGGMRFSDNPALRCNDAHDLKDERLEQMVADFSSIREIDFRFDRTANEESGGGSTLDVLTGGPPCQGYSGIGIRRSYAVDRKVIPSNHLYGRMAEIIRRLRPRIFLFENVRGLLNAKWTREGGEPIWPEVLREFKEHIPGYEVRWSLVHAKDYGVPQNRPRVLIVGIRKDILADAKKKGVEKLDDTADTEDAVKCGFLPAGCPGEYPDLGELLGDLLDDDVEGILLNQSYPPGPFETKSYPRAAKKGTIQEKLRKAPDWYPHRGVRLTEQEYSKHKWAVVDKFRYMLGHNGEIPEKYKTRKFSQRVLKEKWGNAEPNITATSLPDDYVHYRQPRILTVREWARLQLFPDWYQFAGKRTTGGLRRAGKPTEGIFDREVPKYTQIGNAVPVGLAERVGKHFKMILDAAVDA